MSWFSSWHTPICLPIVTESRSCFVLCIDPFVLSVPNAAVINLSVLAAHLEYFSVSCRMLELQHRSNTNEVNFIFDRISSQSREIMTFSYKCQLKNLTITQRFWKFVQRCASVKVKIKVFFFCPHREGI